MYVATPSSRDTIRTSSCPNVLGFVYRNPRTCPLYISTCPSYVGKKKVTLTRSGMYGMTEIGSIDRVPATYWGWWRRKWAVAQVPRLWPIKNAPPWSGGAPLFQLARGWYPCRWSISFIHKDCSAKVCILRRYFCRLLPTSSGLRTRTKSSSGLNNVRAFQSGNC